MFIALSLLIAVGVCEAQVVVDRATTIGEIKPMNGVNNGPLSPTIKGNVQGRNNTEVYAAAIQVCQNSPIDILMYYDASPNHEFTGIFDHPTLQPTKTYYSLYAWRRLAEYGTQVKATSSDKDIYVTAARNANGKMRVMVTRYNDDNNVVTPKRVKIAVGENLSGETVAHITDSARCYTEIPLVVRNGEVEVAMEPNSVVVIDFE